MTDSGRRSSAGCGGVEDAGVGTGASRPDSLGWEKEELAADLAVVFDSRGEPRDDGDELDTGAAVEELGEERNGPDPEISGRNGERRSR